MEIGEFQIDGDHLTAKLHLVVCGRSEDLTLLVDPLGDDIAVEVRDAILDYIALREVARCVAHKLNNAEGRAALESAAGGPKQERRWGPQVRVPLDSPKSGSNG